MIRTPALLGILVLAAGCLGIACGGDDGGEMTAEEYFTELEQIAQDFDADGEALSESFDEEIAETGDDFEAGLDAIRSFFAESLELTEGFVDDIEALDPPEDVAEVHEDAVEAGRDTLDTLQAFADELDEVETEEDLLESLDGFEGPGDEFSASCRELESAAAENDIDIDLACEEPAEG